MERLRPEYKGADFTLQAGVQLLLTGWLAEQLGYQALFISAGVLGLLPLVGLHFWRGVGRGRAGQV